MKRTLCLLVGLISVASPIRAQVAPTDSLILPRRFQLGLDLAKMPIAWIGNPRSDIVFRPDMFYTIEPIIRLERLNRRQWWQGQLGVTRYTGAAFGRTYLNLTGGFLKVGMEWIPRPNWAQAVLLTTSFWQTTGEVRIPAGAFGATTLPVPTATGVALGVEGQTNRDFPLGQRWLIRLCIRYGLFHNRLPNQSIPPPYLPGLGRYSGLSKEGERTAPVAVTGGLTLNLFYTLSSRAAQPQQPLK